MRHHRAKRVGEAHESKDRGGERGSRRDTAHEGRRKCSTKQQQTEECQQQADSSDQALSAQSKEREDRTRAKWLQGGRRSADTNETRSRRVARDRGPRMKQQQRAEASGTRVRSNREHKRRWMEQEEYGERRSLTPEKLDERDDIVSRKLEAGSTWTEGHSATARRAATPLVET